MNLYLQKPTLIRTRTGHLKFAVCYCKLRAVDGPLATIESKAFSKSTKLLSKLDMSNNDLGGWPDKSGLKALSNCIAVSRSLQDLDVSLNDLRGEDASILATALAWIFLFAIPHIWKTVKSPG